MGASRGALRAFLAVVLAARAGEAPEEAAALAPRIAALLQDETAFSSERK